MRENEYPQLQPGANHQGRPAPSASRWPAFTARSQLVSRRQPRRAGSPATATPAGPSSSGHRPRGPSASRSAAYASTRRRTSGANGASASLPERGTLNHRTKILKANYALGKLSQAVDTLVTVQFAFRNGYEPQRSISCPPSHEHPLRGFRRVFVGIKDDISSRRILGSASLAIAPRGLARRRSGRYRRHHVYALPASAAQTPASRNPAHGKG